MLSAAIQNLEHAFPGHNSMLYIMSESSAHLSTYVYDRAVRRICCIALLGSRIWALTVASLQHYRPARHPSAAGAHICGIDSLLTTVTGIYVLGFVVGPLLWAPCSEVFGRRAMFVFTYIPFTAFNAGVCGAKTLNALLVMRFFAGTFGSSTMTNSG